MKNSKSKIDREKEANVYNQDIRAMFMKKTTVNYSDKEKKKEETKIGLKLDEITNDKTRLLGSNIKTRKQYKFKLNYYK